MSSHLITPDDGRRAQIGGMGVRFMLGTDATGGSVAVVEHPLAPRALASPLHRHSREDETSYVLSGRVGAQLGDEVVIAEAGDLIWKPRGQWHAFWNAGDEPASLIEVISPSGFECYFEELGGLDELTPEAVMPLAVRYGIELRPESIPVLCERHGLHFGPPVTA